MQQIINELQMNTSYYETWLGGEMLSQQTRRAYMSRLKRFKAFLEYCTAPEQSDKTRALRDLAQRYHDHLMLAAGAKPSSVNASITAVYHYYGFLGHKVPPVLRDWVLKNEPRILTREEQDRLILATASQPSVRDRAMVTLLMFTGIRIGECRELQLGNVEISAHAGRIRVTSRNRTRSIPLNQIARQAMLQWLIERAQRFDCDDNEPVFPNKSGEFMTRAAVDEVVRKVARTARLNICAQILRNTFLTTLLERGNTLELVAELGGQAKLEHVRRFRKGMIAGESIQAFFDSPFNSMQETMQMTSLTQ